MAQSKRKETSLVGRLTTTEAWGEELQADADLFWGITWKEKVVQCCCSSVVSVIKQRFVLTHRYVEREVNKITVCVVTLGLFGFSSSLFRLGPRSRWSMGGKKIKNADAFQNRSINVSLCSPVVSGPGGAALKSHLWTGARKKKKPFTPMKVAFHCSLWLRPALSETWMMGPPAELMRWSGNPGAAHLFVHPLVKLRLDFKVEEERGEGSEAGEKWNKQNGKVRRSEEEGRMDERWEE